MEQKQEQLNDNKFFKPTKSKRTILLKELMNKRKIKLNEAKNFNNDQINALLKIKSLNTEQVSELKDYQLDGINIGQLTYQEVINPKFNRYSAQVVCSNKTIFEESLKVTEHYQAAAIIVFHFSISQATNNSFTKEKLKKFNELFEKSIDKNDRKIIEETYINYLEPLRNIMTHFGEVIDESEFKKILKEYKELVEEEKEFKTEINELTKNLNLKNPIRKERNLRYDNDTDEFHKGNLAVISMLRKQI